MESKAAALTTTLIARRMAGPQRRRQLLDVALSIVREEGADALTLGRLALRAGVSKPVAYDHFGTRSHLLIELYRWIDSERVNEFRGTMRGTKLTVEETVEALATAYVECAANTQGEFSAIGAALSGSADKAVVLEELLGNYVEMFVEVLSVHSRLEEGELRRRSVGFVGAGEALASAVMHNKLDNRAAASTLAVLMRGAIGAA